MTDRHANLRVRFYPSQGTWTCIVQRLGADGMPTGVDVLSSSGSSREEAWQHALEATEDPLVREVLEAAAPQRP
jgi:hypothetical protein